MERGRSGTARRFFPSWSSANAACGVHARNPVTMHAILTLARQFNVRVGAHPGFPDRVEFSRRILEASPEEAYADGMYQVSALAGMTASLGTPLQHTKAHGALVTTAWRHAPTAQAAHDGHPTPPLLVLSTLLETEARELGVPVVMELFPEWAYTCRTDA
ncbi:LamB/YcsF family protein [Deinococcus oregonensis]|uniref:LamB/YcsF family protein n=1 Tax=Deinococcus oregonensis TaxID=1805970 RepID=A0ABV6B5E2_9DEIO